MSKRLVSVFMGTPAFAVPALRVMAEASEVRLVVTQPDRPVGRGRKVEQPPVKQAALELGIEVVQPTIVKGRRFTGTIAALEPDLVVTAAYGRILGRALLATPRLGCLNVHASLLPAYRGAAPINHAILAGDRETGVSIMRMDEGLDTGPVYRTASLEIGAEETAGELTVRLAELGAETLGGLVPELEGLQPTPQDHSRASWAPLLKKADGILDWRQAAAELDARVRGLSPWPGTTTRLAGVPLKIHRALPLSDSPREVAPGTVVAHTALGLDVACGRGVLRLTELQLPGKKRLDAAAFRAGRKIETGAVLGED